VERSNTAAFSLQPLQCTNNGLCHFLYGVLRKQRPFHGLSTVQCGLTKCVQDSRLQKQSPDRKILEDLILDNWRWKRRGRERKEEEM